MFQKDRVSRVQVQLELQFCKGLSFNVFSVSAGDQGFCRFSSAAEMVPFLSFSHPYKM